MFYVNLITQLAYRSTVRSKLKHNRSEVEHRRTPHHTTLIKIEFLHGRIDEHRLGKETELAKD